MLQKNFMKKIIRPLFTLRFEPVRERRFVVGYKMFVEDIKYKRGMGPIEIFNGVKFSSNSFIDPKYILAGFCYLPGTHTDRQEWAFLTKKQFDKLKGKEIPHKTPFKVGGSVTVWSKKRPTAKDCGKWFFVKHDDKKFPPIVRFKKVRIGEKGRLYLCSESDSGIHAETFGIPLDLFLEKYTEFAGPIEIPK